MDIINGPATGENGPPEAHSTFCELDQREFTRDFMRLLANSGVEAAYGLLSTLMGAPGGGRQLAKYLPSKKAPAERCDHLPCPVTRDPLMLDIFQWSYYILRDGLLGAIAHFNATGAPEQVTWCLACISALQSSKPVRSRITDDFGCLDALAYLAARAFAARNNWELPFVGVSSQILAMSTGQKWRPYAGHVKAQREKAAIANAARNTKMVRANEQPPLDLLVAEIQVGMVKALARKPKKSSKRSSLLGP